MSTWKRIALVGSLSALALLPTVPAARPAHAAGMVVNTLADANPPVTDGLCSLREAIANANDNAATYADCPMGAGADTITFSLSGTIVLTAELPIITDPAGLTIDGSGQSVAVSGNNSVLPFNMGAALTLRHMAVTGGNGGISNFGHILTMTDTTISGNTAAFHGGAGIFNNFGTVTVTNSSISGNSAPFGGAGAIYNNSGTVTVTNSTISNNSNSFGGAGAIFNILGTVTVTTSTISGNTAPREGGGIYQVAGTLAVMNSTITGNTAITYGGGIYHSGGTLTVTNSTIAGNTATWGGGITNGGTASVTNTTVTGNIATSIGGGINNRSTGIFTAVNSVVADNIAPTGADCSGTLSATGSNLIGDPTGCTITGTPPTTGDARLGPLADNGGPTKTHALLPGSPAIDAGDDAVCTAAPVSGKDQRGVTRPQGAHCDLGAFELEHSAPVVGGKNLRITTGTIDLSWDGGTAQTGYTLLQYNANTAAAQFIPIAGAATSYSDATAVPGGLYCYALAAKGAGDVVLGLSDLLCAMTGIKTGAVAPVSFALALNQSATATLTWTAPAGGADAYLLQRLPLDGSPPTQVTLPGSATSSTQTVPVAGGCFQLVAYKGSAWGASDALCGVPGFSTLGIQTTPKVRLVGDALAVLKAHVTQFVAPSADSAGH